MVVSINIIANSLIWHDNSLSIPVLYYYSTYIKANTDMHYTNTNINMNMSTNTNNHLHIGINMYISTNTNSYLHILYSCI